MLHDGMHSALNTVCEKNFKHFKKLYALKIATPEKNVFVFFYYYYYPLKVAENTFKEHLKLFRLG